MRKNNWDFFLWYYDLLFVFFDLHFILGNFREANRLLLLHQLLLSKVLISSDNVPQIALCPCRFQLFHIADGVDILFVCT